MFVCLWSMLDELTGMAIVLAPQIGGFVEEDSCNKYIM